MENASKALIIAGSILLAIAIIGIGMYVFTQASDLVDTTKLTAIEIATYNGEFEYYEGKQRGVNVRVLLDKVIQHNIANQGDISRQIGVGEGSGWSSTTNNLADPNKTTTTAINNIKSGVRLDSLYIVGLTYNSNSGLIVNISILEEGST